MTIHTDVLYIS